MIALFREMSDLINLDWLHLKKKLEVTYFSKFLVMFKVVKFLQNHFYLLYNLLQKDQYIKIFLWYCGGAFISNVEDIGIFTFWIKIKKRIGLVSLICHCFHFKKWQKTYHKKKSRLPLNCWRGFYLLDLQLCECAHSRYH